MILAVSYNVIDLMILLLISLSSPVFKKSYHYLSCLNCVVFYVTFPFVHQNAFLGVDEAGILLPNTSILQERD